MSLPLTGAPDVVAVGQDPGDDLHLLAPHPPAGDLEVAGRVVVGTLGEEVRDVLLVIKHDVDVALRWRRRAVLAGPLDPEHSKTLTSCQP